MNGAILQKLEIDVLQANELFDAVELAVKYTLPALVVHPNLATEALMIRGRRQGKFKLITPVDWPKGETFGNVKLRGLSQDALSLDGFEILLTPGKTEAETRNEAAALSQMIRDHLDDDAEVRFVLGSQVVTAENLDLICKALIGIRTPKLVRNDVLTKTQATKANAETHQGFMAAVRQRLGVPIKLSGNIASIKIVTACDAAKFAVNLQQARAIIREYNQQPPELSSILA